ncbi:DUF4145 domain-containing protein [Nitrobacter sp. TKz-YC02]|uniref:DUF4145 domain-containing protein n=1 Tax=Nitrobacter sp. TKz-YC02 TaxID=3398704 RepID=UPI003CF1DB30
MEKSETKKAMCAVCAGMRNCDVRGNTTERWDDAGGLVWGRTDWFILQCRGCDHVFCQTIKIFSEDYQYEWDDAAQEDVLVYDETVAYWPAILDRKAPDWFSSGNLPVEKSDMLEEAMNELYIALEHDLSMLAAAGVRTAFDIASELLDVDSNLTFKQKLDALVADNRITNLDRERLETLTEAGSASMHRGWVPEKSDLLTMVEILEHFVHQAFVAPALQKKLDERSARLKQIVPPRKPRQQKA